MLERATTCLKSGAARDSLRCTGKATRSQRMLHSTFWNHGAAALDLPPWAVSLLSIPSHLSTKHDSHNLGTGGRNQSAKSPSDGIFLDFLYPPQALACLQRASRPQKLQTWEKRNIRRLPKGFVDASRGYASRTSHRKPQEQFETDEERADFAEDEHTRDHSKESDKHRAMNDVQDFDAFMESPGELAEEKPNRLNALRNLIRFNRDAKTSQHLVSRAWNTFQSLDEHTRGDRKLVREFLDWLALQHDATAAAHGEELYRSIPTGERTLEIYTAMLSIYLMQKNWAAASNLHHESLQTLANGYMVSRTLFDHATEHDQWHLAVQTAVQHHKRYNELNQENQIRLFWIRVSETPRLFHKASKFWRHLHGPELRHADTDTQMFATRFLKEAVSQVLGMTDDFRDGEGLSSSKKLTARIGDRQTILAMIRYLVGTIEEPAKFLDEALHTLIFQLRRSYSYGKYHFLVSGIYRLYRELPQSHPSQNLLAAMLERLTWYEPQRNRAESSFDNITISDLADDWKALHGHLPQDAYSRIVSCFAWSGQTELHEFWMQDFQLTFPDFEQWQGSLWTCIYLYARRMDLDKAQQAFATVKRLAADHGAEPDLKCWVVLLHAHGRADDLEGAFTNFQNLVDSAKLAPNEACFAPILGMLANRGDVEGAEDFLRQYDDIVKSERSTTQVAMLMNAYVKNGDMEQAEAILRDTIQRSKSRQVVGHLTPCFNALMKGYALRNKLQSVIETYQWMMTERNKPDGDTFFSIIKALMAFRRRDDARRVIEIDMPKYNVEPTAAHHAILMQGLVKMRSYQHALSVYNSMVKQNIKPSPATNALRIKAQVELERHHKRDEDNKEGQPGALDESIKMLETMLEQHTGEEFAGPRYVSQDFDDSSAGDPAVYFETLIAAHGERNCLDAVRSLFNRYQDTAKRRGVDSTMIPLGLTSKLMSAHWNAGEFDQVEEYWKLAKQRADEVAPPMPVPSFRYLVAESSLQSANPLDLRPMSDDYDDAKDENSNLGSQPSQPSGQVLLTDHDASIKVRPASGRRHILNEPLRWYLSALFSQSRLTDAIAIVSRVLTQGYTMDIATWNMFVRCLLDTSPPLALLAFTLTENFLAPGFTKWFRGPKTRYPSSYGVQQEGTQYMKARFLARNRLMPHYKTLVRLGGAFLDVRKLERQGRGALRAHVPPELQRFVGTTREIRGLATRTLRIIQSMPYVAGDALQDKYLRRGR